MERDSKSEFEAMLGVVHKQYPEIQGIFMNPADLVFEEWVKMSCFYCGRYNNSWKCPPKLPAINYPKMMCEYQKGAFVYVKIPFNEQNYNDVRTDSSIIVHRALLLCEKWLWQNNYSSALSFIGGSCKLCKNGCGKERCNNPYEARSPLEATGVNVVKSAEKYGLKISFPPTEYMMRVGLLLW